MQAAQQLKTQKRPVNLKIQARALTAIVMLFAWTLVSVSGFVLYSAPEGRRSGNLVLLFNLTKHEWGDVHFWLALTAVGITLVHLALVWRGFCGCIKYAFKS